jgi:uncharacterized small protein (DUF1192 family)
MEEDERQKPAPGLPRPLQGLSIEDLEAYVAALEAEISRVEAEMGRQRAIRGAAEALFRPPPKPG